MSRSSEGGGGRSASGGGDGPRVCNDRPVYLDATEHTLSNCKKAKNTHIKHSDK